MQKANIPYIVIFNCIYVAVDDAGEFGRDPVSQLSLGGRSVKLLMSVGQMVHICLDIINDCFPLACMLLVGTKDKKCLFFSYCQLQNDFKNGATLSYSISSDILVE